jgi:hypothetical protein
MNGTRFSSNHIKNEDHSIDNGRDKRISPHDIKICSYTCILIIYFFVYNIIINYNWASSDAHSPPRRPGREKPHIINQLQMYLYGCNLCYMS